MTNERNCALAKYCKNAAKEGVCTTQCSAFIAVDSRYKNARIPDDYRNLFLENSPARETQKKIYDVLNTYIDTFSKENVRVKNVYLYSQNPGTGKTTTAIALLNEYIRIKFLIHTKNGRTAPEQIGIFWDVNEFHTNYNLASMSNDSEKMERIMNDIDRFSSVEFLVVDDIGVRSASESFRALVHSVINRRVTNNLATVFTSNVRIEDLKSVFDERLYDRIKDQCVVLTFQGESKRGRR